MMLNTARKLVCYNTIDRIPTSLRRRVIKVYRIIDKIEFFNISPWYFSMLAPVLTFVLCSNFKWPQSILLLILLLTLSYFLSVVSLKLIFSFFIKEKIAELKLLVKGRFKYKRAFKKVQEIDPVSCKNAKVNDLGLLDD